jgi:hypothetical protein
MPIQFIPSEQSPLGTIGQFIDILHKNQMMELQSKQLDLEAQKTQSEIATQQLIRDRTQLQLNEETDAKKALGDYVDETYAGENVGYRELAKTFMGNVLLERKQQMDLQNQNLEQDLQVKHQLLAQTQARFNAEMPFYGQNAAAQAGIAQSQNRLGGVQASTAEQTQPFNIAGSLATTQGVLAQLPPAMQSDILSKNPWMNKYYSAEGDLFNEKEMMSELMKRDSGSFAKIWVKSKFGQHEQPQFDPATNTMFYPSDRVAESMTPIIEKYVEELKNKTKGGGATTQPTTSSDKSTAISQTVQDLNKSQKIFDSHVGYFNQANREITDKSRSSAAPGERLYGQVEPIPQGYAEPSEITRTDWSEPPKHFGSKGFKDYTSKDLDNIFSISKTPDATPQQAARMNFFLDKLIQSSDKDATYKAFVKVNPVGSSRGPTPTQLRLLVQLNQIYKWGIVE